MKSQWKCGTVLDKAMTLSATVYQITFETQKKHTMQLNKSIIYISPLEIELFVYITAICHIF